MTGKSIASIFMKASFIMEKSNGPMRMQLLMLLLWQKGLRVPGSNMTILEGEFQ